MNCTIKIVPHAERPMKFANGKPGEDAKNLEIGIIQHGTLSGQTVIAFKLETVDGRNIFAEITANQFRNLVAAYNGAEMRFHDIKQSN